MPRAPSLDQLLDFESRWDEALSAVLRQLQLPVFTPFDPIPRDQDGRRLLKPPYLEALFTFLGEAPAGGGELPQQRGGDIAGRFTVVSYRGRFDIVLHVHRGAQTREALAFYRGGVRRLFLPHVAAFNGLTVPFYDLRQLTIAEGERTVDEERDLDQVRFRYEFIWSIQDEAWPT